MANRLWLKLGKNAPQSPTDPDAMGEQIGLGDATRAKRIATAVEWLAEGKQRNWRYR